MGDFVPKAGSGALFKNRDKARDSHPDYRGNFVDPDGRAWDLAAWLKEGKGGTFMSLKVSEPYRGGKAAGDAPSPSAGRTLSEALDDGEIPF